MWHPQPPESAKDFNQVVVLHMEPGEIHELYQQAFRCTYKGFRDRDRPSVELFSVRNPPELEQLPPKVLYMLYLNPTGQNTTWERWVQLCADPLSLRAFSTSTSTRRPGGGAPRYYPDAPTDSFTQELIRDEKFLTVDF